MLMPPEQNALKNYKKKKKNFQNLLTRYNEILAMRLSYSKFGNTNASINFKSNNMQFMTYFYGW